MLTPLAIILMVMYTLNMYNAWVEYDRTAGNLLETTEQEVFHQQQLLRKKQQKEEEHNKHPETLVLTTKHGKIRIVLRPDLSPGSIDYIHRVIDSKSCKRCKFYRAEKPGILQGVLANSDVGFNKEKGKCPPGAEKVSTGDCPEWDPHCACHGPLMTRGMVAWAAGQAGGPDFFIDMYQRPAAFWGTQHTNFGQIVEEESLKLVDSIFELPKYERGGMTLLTDDIHFDMSLD
jgi:cyclophilin family peptidyl-prolyl cis-trans isomerase